MPERVPLHVRATALVLNSHGRKIVTQILDRERPHKDLKIAFDWENTPEGHAYWSSVRRAEVLPREAIVKLCRAVQIQPTNYVN
jgi:hypothetical protein